MPHKTDPRSHAAVPQGPDSPAPPATHRIPGIVRPPGWKAFPWLRAGFSTREGGVTTVYAYPTDLNLGWTATDPPANVADNRRRFVEAVTRPYFAAEPPQLVAVRQIHSSVIHVVDEHTSPLLTSEGKPVLEGDGLITATPDRLLAILTADCVPVLVADTRLRIVAGFHAGWRGTLGGIVEQGIDTLRLRFGSRPADLIAAVGPAIGACCYAVGDEVRDAFTAQFDYASELFSAGPSQPGDATQPADEPDGAASNPGAPPLHLNLAEANRRQLLRAGLHPASIAIVGECTACTRLENGQRRYFSHRAEHGFTGRMLSVIGVVNA